jgi:tetratricopeptide (TPR) repeat protein
MENENDIKFTHRSAFSTKVETGEKEYLVVTERTGTEKIVIASRVYLDGKLISTSETELGGEGQAPATESAMDDIMRDQHNVTITTLKLEKLREAKSPSEYLEETKGLLRRKNNKNALLLLEEAHDQYPDDPFILSYYGCLTAIVGKDYDRGVEACMKAIENLRKKIPFGEDFFYPSLYLNLGRAYLASGDRKEAIDVFIQGLKSDKENSDLLWELRKLGRRRSPAVPFLKRSNPINRYIGKLLHKVK